VPADSTGFTESTLTKGTRAHSGKWGALGLEQAHEPSKKISGHKPQPEKNRFMVVYFVLNHQVHEKRQQKETRKKHLATGY
jgi:hypothetical protein